MLKSMSLRRELFRIGTIPKQVDDLFQMGAQFSPVYTLGMSAGETGTWPTRSPVSGQASTIVEHPLTTPSIFMKNPPLRGACTMPHAYQE